MVTIQCYKARMNELLQVFHKQLVKFEENNETSLHYLIINKMNYHRLQCNTNSLINQQKLDELAKLNQQIYNFQNS